TAILIDPFSQPDENGHYFDFSAVPFKLNIDIPTKIDLVIQMILHHFHKITTTIIILFKSRQIKVNTAQINIFKFIK
ncbi:opine metallophore biosynthesis dehydrogenase, partial [Staphylococcus aureus]|nr:opine metallophore biosynthesis dehydrogenase [Staphylococcus aureus]